MMRRRLTALSIAVCGALLSALVVATPAVAAEENGMPVTSVASDAAFSVPAPRVPIVDSALGAGEPLAAGVPATVTLGVPSGTAAALVRISVFAAASPAEVDAAGTPAIFVGAQNSTSTTVLVPVSNGAAVFESSSTVDWTLELLADFGQSSAPGATVALGSPIKRADTSAGLAGTALGTKPLDVGVTGEGGVPSEHVSAVYATATVTTDAADTLALGDQAIDVQAGTTSITTLLSVGTRGTVSAALAHSTGSLRLDVRGYVAAADQNVAALTVAGGYVPLENPQSKTIAVSAASPLPLDSSPLTDSAYSVVLVSAAESTATSILSLGAEPAGRAAGAVTDLESVTPAQLELVPNGSVASLRRGSTKVTLVSLGNIVAATGSRSTDLALTLDSPTPSSVVDLSEHDTFSITGTVTSSTASLGAVTIYSGDTSVGTAAVSYRSGTSTWSFETAAPASGSYTFRAEAADRAGHTVSQSVTVQVTLPNADAVLVASDAVVLDDRQLASVTGAADGYVLFHDKPSFEPGDVLVASPSAGAPEGFLRRVESTDLTADGWRVQTSTAALTDVVRQGTLEADTDLVRDSGVTVDTSNVTPAPSDSTDVTVENGDEPVVSVVNAPAASARSAVPFADGGGLDTRLTNYLTVNAKYSFSPAGKVDKSAKPDSEIEADKRRFAVTGGATIEGQVKIGFELHIVVQIDLTWHWLPSVELQKFSTIFTRSTETSLTAEAFLQASYDLSRTLATVRFTPVTFFIGPVPVVVTGQIDLGMTGEISARASIKVEWAAKISQDYGFEYADGHFVDKTTSPRMTNTPPTFTPGGGGEVSGSIGASIGPNVSLSISIYDAAGPKITAGATVGLDVDVALDNVKVSAYLKGSVAVSLELKVPIIDRVLVNYTVAEAHSVKWVLFSWEMSPAEFNSGGDGGGGSGGSGGDGGATDPNMPRPNPAPEFNASDLRITLYWNNKSDMDLHVTEPSGDTIWYGNKGPTASQGTLDIDSNAGCSVTKPDEPGGIENTYWPNGVTAPSGTYTISVVQWSACSLPDADWVVEIWSGSDLVLKQTGNTARTFSITVGDSSASAGLRTFAQPSTSSTSKVVTLGPDVSPVPLPDVPKG